MQIFDSPAEAHRALGACVATIGKYDGMHLGHQRIVAELLLCARTKVLPAIVILSEPQPEEFFAPATAPARLTPFDDKVELLAELGVAAVLRMRFDASLSQLSAEAFIHDFLVRDLGMRALVIGDDFRFGKNRSGDFAMLQRLAGELHYEVRSVAKCQLGDERVSSTLVRQYLQQGDCGRVAELLGRPFSMSGAVVQGRQLGRQLGVPTANVQLQVAAVPMTGVFAVEVLLDGALLHGVANLGYKPTIGQDMAASLEVHLFDFAADIYGLRLQVRFMHKLRDERKFDGLDALKQQILQDLQAGRRALRLPSSGPAAQVSA
jgi:riboflavin kinase/FMN adenylyltransferase